MDDPLPIEGLDDARASAAAEVDEMLGLLGLHGQGKPRKASPDRWELEARALGAPVVRAAGPTREACLRAAVPELRNALAIIASLSRDRARRLIESADEIERYLARHADLETTARFEREGGASP